MITGLGHVCYIVRDLEAAEAFYRDVLGCTHAFDFINDQGERHGVYLHVGGRGFIELFRGEVGEKAPAQSYAHLCLEAQDLEATVAAIAGRGVEVTPVKMGSDHSRQAWLKDPDGNRIELMEYTAKSKQNPWLKSPAR